MHRFLVLLMLADGRIYNVLPHHRGLFIYHTFYPGDGFLLQVRPAPYEISIMSQITYTQGR